MKFGIIKSEYILWGDFMAKAKTSSNSNYRDLLTESKKAFDEMLKKVRRNCSSADFHSISPVEVDLDEPRYTRRIEATAKMYERVSNFAQQYFPKRYLEPFAPMHDWCFINSMPLQSVDLCNAVRGYTTSAAIWILDVLKAYGKIEDAVSLLPRDPSLLDTVEIEEFWDPCHSYDVIRGMVYVIEHRNDDCVGIKSDEKPPFHRALLDDFTATGTQHQKVPSRTTYEKIIDMIPDLDIEESVNNYEAAFDSCMERYYKFRYVSFSRIKDCVDEIDRSVQSHKKDKKPVSTTPFVPLAVIPERDTVRQMSVREIGISGHVDKVSESQQWKDSIRLLFDKYKKLESDADGLLAGSVSNFSWTYQQWCDNYDETYAPIMIDFKILDPFELCFAYLYLLDTDSDLPWLAYPSSCILNLCSTMMPWINSHTNIVCRYDNYADYRDMDFGSPYELSLEFSGDPVDAQDDDCLETDHRSSVAKAVFDITGCLLPRDLKVTDVFSNILEDYYGMDDKDAAAKVMAYVSILYYVQNKTRFPDISRSLMKTISSHLHQIDELQKTVSDLKKQRDELNDSVHALQRDLKKAQEKSSSEEQKNRAALQELAELREIVYNMNQENAPDESSQKDTDDIVFPYHTNGKIVVFGGHDSWVKAIKPLLPDVRFVPNGNPSVDLIRNADVVWIQANSLSHKVFYKIIDVVRANNIPIHYFSYSSAEKCARQVVGCEV